jgi:hypothetical protein
MINLAPDIFRQRLLMEGIYTIAIDRDALVRYMTGLAAHLELRAYAEPVIYTPAGVGTEANQGFDAFLPLVDSGIAAYVWSAARLFSVILYTCRGFEPTRAIAFTREFFGSDAVESMVF